MPAGREQGYHLFYVLLPDRQARDHVLTRLRAEGIHATFHYVPLHSSPGGRRVQARESTCPVTDDVAGRLLRLPFFTTLADDDVDRVVAAFLRAARSVSPR